MDLWVLLAQAGWEGRAAQDLFPDKNPGLFKQK